MSAITEKFVYRMGKIIFVSAIVWCVCKLIYILIAPVNLLVLCQEYNREGLCALALGNLVLWSACWGAWTFPAGKYWKYVSLGVGTGGFFLFHLLWKDYTSCEQFTWTHANDPLWFVVYPLVLWIVWGMFIPYLEKRLRRQWMFGYIAGWGIVYIIHCIPTPNL